jgi:hypothetical protein
MVTDNPWPRALPRRLATAALVAFSGCGSLITASPAVGPHPEGWLGTHGRAVQRAGGVDKARTAIGVRCAACHTTHAAADGAVPRSPMTFRTCYSCHQGPQGEGR